MGKSSKKNLVLELFFNEPSRHWHFKEIVSEIKISDDRANHWLKFFIKENIIIYIKEKGKMPYYQANFYHSNYKYLKRIFSMQNLLQAGFFSYIESLNVKTIILFGSIIRSDWHNLSDIDIFILGEYPKFEKEKYEKLLNRKIQLFFCKNKEEIQKLNPFLLKNIIKGNFIKGELEDIIDLK